MVTINVYALGCIVLLVLLFFACIIIGTLLEIDKNKSSILKEGCDKCGR